FFFSSRRRHTRSKRDWSSDVCSSDLAMINLGRASAGASLLNLGPALRRGEGIGAESLPLEWRLRGGYSLKPLGVTAGVEYERAEIGRAACRERVEECEGGG